MTAGREAARGVVPTGLPGGLACPRMLRWTVLMSTERVPGRPNALSDLRGGPGTFRGVGYQVQVGAVRLLSEMHTVWRDTLLDRHLRFELREVVPVADAASTKQFGYDLGSQTAAVITAAEEIKSAPVAQDVNEFVARMARLPPAFADADLVLVVASAPEAVRRLDALLRHARERPTAGQLAEFVARAGDGDDRALLKLAGGESAHAALRRARVSVETPSELTTKADVLLSALAAASRRTELAAEILRVVHDGSRSRESVAVGALVERLTREGLLALPAAMDVNDEDLPLLAAFVALEACPVPVPVAVLADALGFEGDAVLGAVERGIRSDKIIRTEEGLLWRLPTSNLMPQDGHEGVLDAMLSRLIVYAGQVPDDVAAAQTPNVLALARILRTRSPATVARAFTAYDKPSKTYGDLTVIHDLAFVARDAARTAAQEAVEDKDTFLDHVSRASICGVSWALQRVGEYEEAAAVLSAARKIAEATGDEKSLAFADKCLGRIERLRGEEIQRSAEPDGAAASAALERSAVLLSGSREAFAGLLARGKADAKDSAESASLLARTHAVAGQLELARETADQARGVLVGTRPGKEWADLRLLDAELCLRGAEESVAAAQDPPPLAGLLAPAFDAVAEVLDAFPPRDDAPWARARSEITARALLLSGRVRAAARDGQGAREHFDAAVALYNELGDDRAAAEAAYESLATAPGSIPAGLTAAAEAAGADRIVLIRALRRHEQRGRRGTDDPAYWQGAVATMVTEVHASRTPWAEKRRSA